MEIKVNLDVSTLSTEEKLALVLEIFESDKNIESKFLKLRQEKDISDDELKKMVNKHFDEYDEVFKALAKS